MLLSLTLHYFKVKKYKSKSHNLRHQKKEFYNLNKISSKELGKQESIITQRRKKERQKL